MTMRPHRASKISLSTVFAIACWLAASGSSYAGPFDRMLGQWSGGGTLDLSDGKHEKLKCRASYDATPPQGAELNIRCASESYNFEIRSSVTNSNGAITGTWSESATLSMGDLSGRMSGSQINVTATSPAFTASLSLVTNGNHQTVIIRSKNPDSKIKGVSIALRRG